MSDPIFSQTALKMRMLEFWRLWICESVAAVAAIAVFIGVVGISASLGLLMGVAGFLGVCTGALWQTRQKRSCGDKGYVAGFAMVFISSIFAPVVLIVFCSWAIFANIFSIQEYGYNGSPFGPIAKAEIYDGQQCIRTIEDRELLNALSESINEMKVTLPNHPKIDKKIGINITFNDGKSLYFKTLVSDEKLAIVTVYKTPRLGWVIKQLAGAKLKEWLIKANLYE